MKLHRHCSKWTVLVIVTLWCNVTLSSPGILQTLDKPDDNTIRVCMFEWYPYSFTREGEAQGIYVSLFRRVGWLDDIQFSIKPLLRCISELRQGKQDIWPYSGSSHGVLMHSDLIAQYVISGVVVPKDSNHLYYKELQQFAGESIGILRGHRLYASLSKEKSILWEPQNSGDSLWRMLLTHRLDGAVGDYVSLTTMQVFREGRVRFLKPALNVNKFKIGVHHQRADLLPALNSALKKMKMSGELDMLYRDYGAIPFSELEQFAKIATHP